MKMMIFLKYIIHYLNMSDSRYKPQNLSKQELVNIAIKSQFLVSEIIRKISKRNLAESIQLEREFIRPSLK